MFLNKCGNGVDSLHHFPGNFNVGKFQAVILFQGDYQLQRINRIESQTMRAEQRLVIANFRRTDFKHAVFNQRLFDLVLEFT